MNDFVDAFLIVTSTITHSGLPIKISFYPFDSYIKNYRKKIILYNISFPSSCTNSFRKSMNINSESLVIISDLDEISTKNAMVYLNKNPPSKLYVISGFLYYYNYRNIAGNWSGVVVVKALNCIAKEINNYRNNRMNTAKHSFPIFPSLTHCSYCYKSISLIQRKLISFAHKEYSKSPYTDRYYIKN